MDNVPIILYKYIRLSEKFLSFHEEIIDAQCFLSNYVQSILLRWDKHRDISQTWFHVYMNVHRCKKHVCERKILFGQSNAYSWYFSLIAVLMKFQNNSCKTYT